MKHLLAMGNGKLSNKIGIWNLPTGITCPGATMLCKQGMACREPGKKKPYNMRGCYAKRPEGFRPAVMPSRERNRCLSQLPEFVARMAAEITTRKIQTVRIHESGDVYSQEYLTKWLTIAVLLPLVKFYMYTKSYHLFNWSGKPDNLIVYRSIDRSTPAGRLAASHPALVDAPTAYLLCPDEEVPTDAITCETGGLAKKYCGKTCTICMEGKYNVYFEAH